MKTQISRDSFQPGPGYSGVYLQQGRMILDADWNELTDIEKARLVAALRDAIGGGAPRVGGLRIVDLTPAPAATPTICIQPGALYVEGVAARLDAAAPLALDAQPGYPIGVACGGQSLKLYADVWERSVTALEQSALLDAALHGADTATRSQTMLQVKWCGNSIDPLNAAQNPPQGDASLSVKLRLIASGGDACDPCASQIKVDERLGNYLFRVEVHDYDAASQWLTLKWSRDNGAEACAVAAMPSGFSQGDWLWEFFDNDTERLLGNHFMASPPKLRGLISKTNTTPVGASDPKTYARQWDGAMRINLGSGALENMSTFPSRDRGVDLTIGAVSSQAQGRVNLTAGVLKVNLERVELELAVAGKRFVPGDYWLAEVREARDASGDTVLTAALPRGVRHHYLFLGELAINKRLVAQDDAFQRRMNFPPLTDIVAHDVGLTNTCSKLFGTAVNVQQALDNLCSIAADDIAFTDTCAKLFGGATNVQQALTNLCAIAADDIAFTDPCNTLFSGATNVQQALANLCNIAADDIAYALPACTGNTVKNALKTQLDPENDNKLTVSLALDTLLCQLGAASLPYTVPACTTPSVRERLGLAAGDNQVGPVLDKLLCEFNAGDLPLDRSPAAVAALCSDLQPASVVSVQDALNILCNKSGGACQVKATSSGHLSTLLTDFATTSKTDLWICLPPGTYPLASVPAITGKRSLRISGEGPESAAITFSGSKLSLGANEVILENLALTFSNPAGQMAISADAARASGCYFSRSTTSANGPAMITVGGIGSAACRMAWRDNVLYAQVATVIGTPSQWVGDTVVSDATLSAALLTLGQDSMLNDKAAYDAAMNQIATQIMAMTPDKRLAWKTNLAKVTTTKGMGTRALGLVQVAKANTAPITEILAQSQSSYSETLAAVGGLVAQFVSYSPDLALELLNQKVGGVIEGNQVDGWLLLGNGVAGISTPTTIVGVSLTGNLNVVKSGGETLSLVSNSLDGLRANIPSAALNNKKSLVAAVDGHARITLSGNRFKDVFNTITAANLVAQGNTWGGSDLGYALVDRAVFSGNLVDIDATVNSVFMATTSAGKLAAAGNLQVTVTPMR